MKKKRPFSSLSLTPRVRIGARVWREREVKERGEEVKGRRREEVRRGLENNICVGRTKTERRQRFFFSFIVRLVVVV